MKIIFESIIVFMVIALYTTLCLYVGYEFSQKPMLTRVYHYKNNKMIKQETFVNDALRYGCEDKNDNE